MSLIISQFEPALVFIYPGENTGPNNVASPAPTAPTTSAPPPTPAPPTTPALPPTSPTPPDRQMQVHRRYQHPVFPNYHGNPLVMDNWPRDIPAEANTSLWLDGLRGDVTHRDVLASIRNAGNIKQLHINKAGDDHLGSSAAKIVFFTRQAAECVLAASLAGRFIVGGVVPRVTWNRWRTQEDPPLGRSRVLIIRGPSAIANRAFLETFWGSRMWWDVDEVIERPSCINDGRSIVRYYFGSWRCQAATAKRELEKAFGAVVVVYYGEDPCACSGRDC
ncbi:hypothetical protein F5X99DRAFT_383786 [Biscogniauxia marginata]|nr:hypothetical protein F5X99DRAFT_383786 [Biscogniauxia marginata]